MFCSFLDIRLEKTIKPMFLLSALLFVLGVQVCFGQIVKKRGGPQVINKDLVVTKTLSVGLSPNALHYGSGAKLIVGGMTETTRPGRSRPSSTPCRSGTG